MIEDAGLGKKNRNKLPKATRTSLMLIAMVLVAFALRCYRLDYQSLWRDEVDAIVFSQGTFLELVQQLTRRGHNGPLYFVFLKGWRSLSGDSEFALRYFSLVGGVLMVPLIYRVGRRLGLSKVAAAAAALLVTTSPYLVWYSQEAKMYTWLACLILISVYAYQAALLSSRRSSGWWALFVISTSLAFYTHILSPLMLAVFLAWAWLQRSLWQRHRTGWVVSMSLLSLPYLPLIAWQLPLLLNQYQSGHPFYPIERQVSLLVQLYSSGILQSNYGLYAVGIAVFLLLVGLFLSNEARPEPLSARQAALPGLWLGLPIILIYLISLQVSVFEDRYLIYVIPAFYVLIAVGLTVVVRYSRLVAMAIFGIFLVLNLVSIYYQASRAVKADFRAAAEYIAGSKPESPTVMFQMPYLQSTFSYYFPEPYQSLAGPWTNNDRDPTSVEQDLTNLTAGANRVWLVISEESMWDERALTRQWFEQSGRLIDEAHFTRVDVYQYELKR